MEKPIELESELTWGFKSPKRVAVNYLWIEQMKYKPGPSHIRTEVFKSYNQEVLQTQQKSDMWGPT